METKSSLYKNSVALIPTTSFFMIFPCKLYSARIMVIEILSLLSPTGIKALVIYFFYLDIYTERNYTTGGRVYLFFS